MTEQGPCPFCAIARGETGFAEIIYEANEWVAFIPPAPATVGHTLVIPRQHVVDAWHLHMPLGADLMRAIIDVGRAIDRAIQPDGMNLISSAGEAASQSVFHLHFHLVPRRDGDAFGDIWPPKVAMPEEEREDVAELIRAAYSSLPTLPQGP